MQDRWGGVQFETLDAALGSLLPRPIEYEYTREFVAEAALTPDEIAYLARVRPKRRLEFTTGRRCAQLALAALGRGVAGLGREEDGRPRWPPGVVGSVSHCDGLCVAAVASQEAFAGLGIDVEPRAPLPEGVLELVASPQEIAALPYADFCGEDRPPLDTILFSGKESVFKALYPEVRRFFGFEDVTLALAAGGRFEARLEPRLALEAGRRALTGRFVLTRDLVLTALFVSTADDS